MYATTQKTGYFGPLSNCCGAWWGGLAAVIAGIIGCVHLDKEWSLSAGVINLAAFGVLLAGAVVDGIMATQFWGNMAMCINIKTDLGANAVNLWTQFVDSYMKGSPAALGNPLIANWFTNTNQGNDQYRAYAIFCGFWSVNGPPPVSPLGVAGLSTADQTRLTAQVTSFANQNANQVFCVANNYDKLNAADSLTRNNQFCYQVSTQSPLGISDLGRTFPVLQASVAFNVLGAVTTLITAIMTIWVYTWIHPADADEQGVAMKVSPSPMMPPMPALPPLPPAAPVLPPPLPSAPKPASKIDLKPLGQIK